MKSAALNGHDYQFKTKTNMKTKTSILALTKAFFMLFVICCFSSCSKSNVETKTTDIQVGSYINKIKVIEIDSCEYLWGDWGSATVLTHKGNCKYCAKRSLK